MAPAEPTLFGVALGPWSSWVEAVLTGGSLLLGFSILIRDRRDKRKGQAKRVVVWGDHFTHVVFPKATGIKHPSVVLFIHNASDQPIVGVTVFEVRSLSCPGDSTEDLQVEVPEVDETLSPQTVFGLQGDKQGGGMEVMLAGTQVIKKHCFPEQPRAGRLYVIFMDAQGQTWVKDAVSGKLKRAWRVRKPYRAWKAWYHADTTPVYQ